MRFLAFVSAEISPAYPMVRCTVLGRRLRNEEYLKRMSHATSVSFKLQIQRERRQELPSASIG